MRWLEILITALVSIAASSGFWAYIQSKSTRNSAEQKMVLGLGHDRIVCLCMKYIQRGWVSSEEYENLHDYLYKPYVALGGNGTTKKLMEDVAKLPVKKMETQEESKLWTATGK